MNITRNPKPTEMNVRITSPGGIRIRTLSDEVTITYENHLLLVTLSLEQAEEISEMVYALQRKQPA